MITRKKFNVWTRGQWRKVIRPLDTFLYWLRTHTINRYHIIDIRCPRNGYNWGWIDRDRALLYANFAILESFVRSELTAEYKYGPDIVNLDYEIPFPKNAENVPEYNAITEIKDLFDWWVYFRPYSNRLLDAIECGKNWHMLSEDLERDDREMLFRLINIREHLWT